MDPSARPMRTWVTIIACSPTDTDHRSSQNLNLDFHLLRSLSLRIYLLSAPHAHGLPSHQPNSPYSQTHPHHRGISCTSSHPPTSCQAVQRTTMTQITMPNSAPGHLWLSTQHCNPSWGLLHANTRSPAQVG